MTTPETRLQTLGITLPTPAKPVANYMPWVRSGNQVIVSGQLPLDNGTLTVTGRLGDTVSLENGKAAARQCAINILAHLRDACDGDLSRVVRVVRLGGFVACTPEFTQHPAILNGASDLMVECFGDAGRHARAAVGVASLPMNACVEIDALVEIA